MITQESTEKGTIKKYEAQNYDRLIGMPGFSEKLLKDHFKLYAGYVSNTNASIEKLNAYLKEGKAKTTEYSEIKRRFGWEFNGMRLHEYYFENLGGNGQLKGHHQVAEQFQNQFGGAENWKADFLMTGAMRGIGWVVLYRDMRDDRLFNFWIEEHNANHPVGGQPLLVLDVFEHAYMTDYGTDRSKYLDAFFRNINWDVVDKRMELVRSGTAV